MNNHSPIITKHSGGKGYRIGQASLECREVRVESLASLSERKGDGVEVEIMRVVEKK